MAKTERIDFGPEWPDQWAEIYDPKYLSQRKFEEIVLEMTSARTDPPPLSDGANPDQVAARAASETERGKRIERVGFRDRIQAWHVLDADTGEALGDPQTADLRGLPLGITTAIAQKINDLFEASLPLRSRRG